MTSRKWQIGNAMDTSRTPHVTVLIVTSQITSAVGSDALEHRGLGEGGLEARLGECPEDLAAADGPVDWVPSTRLISVMPAGWHALPRSFSWRPRQCRTSVRRRARSPREAPADRRTSSARGVKERGVSCRGCTAAGSQGVLPGIRLARRSPQPRKTTLPLIAITWVMANWRMHDNLHVHTRAAHSPHPGHRIRVPRDPRSRRTCPRLPINRRGENGFPFWTP
jgi:hypothetical protein